MSSYQEHLRRMADLTSGWRRDVLNGSAHELDALEAEIARLKGRVNELAEFINNPNRCTWGVDIPDTEPEK